VPLLRAKTAELKEAMITKITGVLNRVLDEEVRLQVGPLEYQVLVPEFVRRQVQGRIGQDLTLHTTQYLDGNPMQGRVVPRMIGFLNEAELEFFELFCTVDKVGVRKAIKALMRPIREIADAVQRQDAKWLTTLPGVGAATAEQIVATLRRKVTKFALMPAASAEGVSQPPPTVIDGNLLEDAYQALLGVGHNPVEARNRLDKALAGGRTFKSVEDILLEIYKQAT
jgi:Holliday junction DNA helicase RuvA